MKARRPLLRAAALAGAVVSALLLGGCWGVASMEKTGLVALMGIDAARGSGYRVTVAVIDPLGLPTPTGGAPEGKPELLRSAVASTMPEAVRKLSGTTYLNLDFTHIKGIIVSAQVAQGGLAAPLEFLTRTPLFLETSWVYVARGDSAAKVLRQSEQMTPDAGEVLVGTTTWAHQLFPAYADRLFDLLDQMQTVGDEPATAGVSVATTQGQGPTLAFRMTGTAMFRADRLVGWLDERQTLGWLVATGRATRQTFVAPAAGGGLFTLELLGARRRIRIVPGPSGPRADLRVDIRVALVATERAPADFWSRPSASRAILVGAADTLTGDIRSALQAAQGVGADIFSLGEYVRLQDPEAWSTLRASWDASSFARLPVAIQVNVDIGTFGKKFCPMSPHDTRAVAVGCPPGTVS